MQRSDNARPGLAVFDLFPGNDGVVVLAPVLAGYVARPYLEGPAMTKATDDSARDPKTPAAPAKPKPKQHPGAPVTKAQRAAQMRADKMVIKRMRKK
jgi:hypothetical protein